MLESLFRQKHGGQVGSTIWGHASRVKYMRDALMVSRVLGVHSQVVNDHRLCRIRWGCSTIMGNRDRGAPRGNSAETPAAGAQGYVPEALWRAEVEPPRNQGMFNLSGGRRKLGKHPDMPCKTYEGEANLKIVFAWPSESRGPERESRQSGQRQ